jgi:hypothetical protein
MTSRFVALLVVLALCGRADADTVGLVIAGDAHLRPQVDTQLQDWLRRHGHFVGETMAADAQSSLLNCMVIDDETCARGVVDARANTDSVVFAEIRAPRTKSSTATTLILYWLVKGKAPVGMRRACEDCNEALLRSTLDETMDTLFASSEASRGRLALRSKPPGLTVMLDSENIGITPIERDVTVGQHTVVLMSSGRKVGERVLKIEPEVTVEITMSVTIPSERSRVLPGTLIAVGAAAIAAGAVLYFTSEVDDGTRPTYRDTKPAGLGVAGGGLAVCALGGILWTRAF